jgi:hypothetical protein
MCHENYKKNISKSAQFNLCLQKRLFRHNVSNNPEINGRIVSTYMAGEFSANASLLGYFYQARYALYLLLNAGVEAEISIERFDDIAFEAGGDPIHLLQTKHHISNTGSLSDYSSDLWKTLRVWCTAISKKEVDLSTVIFTLVTTGIASNGSAASKLRPADAYATGKGRDEAAALATLIDVANNSESTANAPAYAAFLNLTDNERKSLLKNIRVLDSSPSIVDVHDKILEKLRIATRPEFLEPVFERIEGWWFKKVVHQLTFNTVSTISYLELLVKVNDVAEQFFGDTLPIDFLEAIIPTEDDLSEEHRVFIHQLRLVMVSESRIRRAINDYYRAFEQRSKWMREDLLGIGELGRYEDRLTEEWGRLHDIMLEDLSGETDEVKIAKRGRDLFTQIDMDFEILIRPRCTEPYVMRGSYHMLANEMKVGWHAMFVERLRELLIGV